MVSGFTDKHNDAGMFQQILQNWYFSNQMRVKRRQNAYKIRYLLNEIKIRAFEHCRLVNSHKNYRPHTEASLISIEVIKFGLVIAFKP